MNDENGHDGPDQPDGAYARRLEELQGVWWKKLLRVQAPYAWNLRRHDLGFFLDVGCGVGRNLKNLGGNGVGVDTDELAVRLCRDQGFVAYSVDDFPQSEDAVAGRFDSMLVAHVLEHMTRSEAEDLVRTYQPYVKPGGKVVLVCPQERGFASDETHVEFLDGPDMVEIAKTCGLEILRSYSFPFPRWTGRFFVYNESIVVGTN